MELSLYYIIYFEWVVSLLYFNFELSKIKINGKNYNNTITVKFKIIVSYIL